MSTPEKETENEFTDDLLNLCRLQQIPEDPAAPEVERLREIKAEVLKNKLKDQP